jgi:uncharacterized membrane protein
MSKSFWYIGFNLSEPATIMVNWDNRTFLIIIWTLHLAMISMLAFSAIGINILLLQPVIAFIFVFFIPGLLFMRVLKLNNLSLSEVILYSVGLSLILVMLVGLLMNFLYPLIGFSKPLSTWPLVISLTLMNGVCSFLVYKSKKEFLIRTNVNMFLSLPTLFLALLPLLAALGMQMINAYQNNWVIFILLPVIAIIPIMLAFTKIIPETHYPLTVVAVALSLLFYGSLFSDYLIGYDIHSEYYFANLVKMNSIWNSGISDTYNGMLSIVVLAPLYSVIANLDLTWVFKVIYPLIYTIVPLCIFHIIRQQSSNKFAFLSVFFFMSVFTFHSEMISLARQQIAELFLVLSILVIICETLNRAQKTTLSIIFGIGIVVSHYSVSYLFLFILISACIASFLLRRVLIFYRGKKKENPKIKNFRETIPGTLISNVIAPSYIILFYVMSLSWYIWLSGASAFKSIVDLTDNIINALATGFLGLTSSQALSLMATGSDSALHNLAKYFHILTVLFIALGIIALLVRWTRYGFNVKYSTFSVISFLIIVASIPVPYLSNALNTMRLYHLNLIFLSPFFILGAIALFRMIFNKTRMKEKNGSNISLKIVAIILAIFLLINTGFVYELAHDPPVSISLSSQWIKTSGDDQEIARFYSAYTPVEDIHSARWLYNNGDIDTKIVYATYSDEVRVHALTSYGMIPSSKVWKLEPYTNNVESGSYIYLQYLNVVENIGTTIIPEFEKLKTFSMDELDQLMSNASKVYANNGSQILITR